MLFSAFCYLASARCEDALKNYSKKALLTLTSARTYILNALDPLSSKMNFFASINEAVNVYNYAIELYEKVNCRVFAASLLVELAVHLQRLGQYQESIFYYKKYLRSTHRSSVLSLAVLKEILYCYFKNGDYEKALVHLDHVTDCQRIPINSCESKAPEVKKEEEFAEVFNFNNNKSDIVDAEITRLLLTLLLIHTEELVSPQYHNYCKKYSYEESDSPIQDIEEHLFYLLQSFVFGITSKDSKSCLQLTELLRLVDILLPTSPHTCFALYLTSTAIYTSSKASHYYIRNEKQFSILKMHCFTHTSLKVLKPHRGLLGLYLDLITDKRLTWRQHVEFVAAKVKAATHELYPALNHQPLRTPQNKLLRLMAGVPYFIRNDTVHDGLKSFSNTQPCVSRHPNHQWAQEQEKPKKAHAFDYPQGALNAHS
ncbi:uncharacterized protein LOC135141083 [Zophobas morio]|uniref:uncharacterized protein LOC135141083 n=1 Tax=Zophobas morio TaxID=2755281 RepID=UPI0030826EF3